MSAKLVLMMGVLGIGGYVGHKVVNYDSAIVPYSQAQVETMLVEAKTVLPRRDGPGQIKIWSTGRSSDGVRLKMQYASWAPVIDCNAVLTPIAADQTRVEAICNDGATSDSAIQRTQDELRVPMFEEHIQSTLNQRAFNRSIVDAKESAAVFKNMGGMQREALSRSAEFERMSEGTR
jgi:hypothetical protein